MPDPRPVRIHQSSLTLTPLLPDGSVCGEKIMRELPSSLALPVWQALRSVVLWAQTTRARRDVLFNGGAIAIWERELLAGSLEETLRNPLAVIAHELDSSASSPQRLSWACVYVTEWALGRGAAATAISFAEAAALAWPEHPRYAWLTGRLMRNHGELRDAEFWLRQAIYAARSCGDSEAQVLGLNSLGNTLSDRGNKSAAEATLHRALRLAIRHGLHNREAELCHDLFILALSRNDMATSQHYAEKALAIYTELKHPRIIFLAHDLVSGWIARGYVIRAHTVWEAIANVLKHLPPHSRPRQPNLC